MFNNWQTKYKNIQNSNYLVRSNIQRYTKNNIVTFNLKEKYNSIIPLTIYTAWHTKELLPKMKKNYERLIRDNPEFEVKLFDNNDCINFIKNNFSDEILNAYNSLIPQSYKSDLWRYCVMYLNGGIYIDIKFKCVNGFKLIALTEKEYWTSDHLFNNTCTGLLILQPKNEIMLKCINKIVENVKNNFYGEGSLHPTGPQLLGEYFTSKEKHDMETNLLVTSSKLIGITFKHNYILDYYSEYREEQQLNKNYTSYGDLWNQRKIYL